MNKYIDLVKSIVPEFNTTFISMPINLTPIDSMDLLAIRVDLENMIGQQIPDSHWVNFKNLNEIFNYCDKQVNHGKTNVTNDSGQKKKIKINMPQMALEALSENWIFKELGDMHWDLLCRGLDTESMQLKDELGNRLYATFTRIRIQASASFNHFLENEEFSLSGQIGRFGNGMYFSNFEFERQDKKISATLMSSFSIRNDTDNTKLLKSQPKYSNNSITETESIPEFANEYRFVKKGVLKSIKLGSVQFDITDISLFTTTYALNPYYDLNGVGLLYFASYPIINNKCEAEFFNSTNQFGRWETSYHILSRDVFYYSNCNIDDSIRYVLNSYEILEDNIIKISSTLYRESDNILMAKIFTLKQKK